MATISSLVIEPTSLIAGLFLILVGYYIFSAVRSYRRLRHFNGPTLAAWSHLWFIRAALSHKCHIYLSDVNAKYGSLARIGPNTLVTCDEEFYKRINTPRAGYQKGDFYKAFRLGADNENVFSETNNERHLYLRKRVAAGYSGRDNTHLESEMDVAIFSMIKSWKERFISSGSTTRPMDFAEQIQYLTLDMITALSFGKSFGWVTTNSDLFEYNGTMANNIPVMNFISAVPILSRVMRIPWIDRSLAPSVRDRVGMGKIKAVSREIISKRFLEMASEKKPSKLDMTSSFISHGLSESEIMDGALLAILAGSDTTAVALRTGLISILTQPRVIRKLQAECDEANVPLDQIISYARALELPYLQGCIKESLRFHPATGGLLPRITPAQGDYYNGKFIPGGTIIGYNAWSLHRLNCPAYGSDANVFRPERWTEAAAAAQAGDSARLDRMEKTVDLVFGYGEFKCLGYRVALIELSKILFELIRRFELGFMDGTKTLESNSNFGVYHQRGMWVRVEER